MDHENNDKLYNVLSCRGCRSLEVHPQRKSCFWTCTVCQLRQKCPSLWSKFLMSGTIEQCYHFIVQMDIQWKESELQIALLLQQARRNGIIIHSDDKVPDKDEQNVQEQSHAERKWSKLVDYSASTGNITKTENHETSCVPGPQVDDNNNEEMDNNNDRSEVDKNQTFEAALIAAATARLCRDTASAPGVNHKTKTRAGYQPRNWTASKRTCFEKSPEYDNGGFHEDTSDGDGCASDSDGVGRRRKLPATQIRLNSTNSHRIRKRKTQNPKRFVASVSELIVPQPQPQPQAQLQTQSQEDVWSEFMLSSIDNKWMESFELEEIDD